MVSLLVLVLSPMDVKENHFTLLGGSPRTIHGDLEVETPQPGKI
jgi:hypothetical protein